VEEERECEGDPKNLSQKHVAKADALSIKLGIKRVPVKGDYWLMLPLLVHIPQKKLAKIVLHSYMM
jgi:hypothetical protein